MSSAEQGGIVSDLATRWLDLRVHTPLAFLEMEVDPEEGAKKLQKQRESLGFLQQMEDKLKRK
jgi:hypothetical protein